MRRALLSRVPSQIQALLQGGAPVLPLPPLSVYLMLVLDSRGRQALHVGLIYVLR